MHAISGVFIVLLGAWWVLGAGPDEEPRRDRPEEGGEMRSGIVPTSRRAIVRLTSASHCSNIVAGLERYAPHDESANSPSGFGRFGSVLCQLAAGLAVLG